MTALTETAEQPLDAAPQNRAIFAGLVALSLLQFGALPYLFGTGWLPCLLLWAAIVAATPLHWGLAHESFHGGYSRDAAANRMAGRILAWFLGMSWDLIRFGHLMHHDANRHPFDRPEVLEPGQSRLGGSLAYFFKLLGGHAMISVVSALGALVPEALTRRLIEHAGTDPELAKIRAAALRAFTNAERRARIRTDLAVIVAIFALAVWLWGEHWPVFAVSIALRWCALSLLDNAPHYGTALDSGRTARNTTIPAPLKWAVMNQNLHSVHHHFPDIGWRDLPAAFRRMHGHYSGSWFAQVARQFHGPLKAEELRPVS
jgi:fatty acid desaturase